MPRREITGLYALTPDEFDTQRLLTQVSAAIEGGASAVQYRNKTATESLRRAQAEALARLCRNVGVPFIVNDHLALAVDVGADGLHLGSKDGDILQARRTLGASCILGVSCYGSVRDALMAAAAGANYIAFGSIFASATKPDAARVPLTIFAQARAAGLAIPMIAIGGITLDNISQLVAAGATAAAIISALFGEREPARIQARAEAFCVQFRHRSYRHAS